MAVFAQDTDVALAELNKFEAEAICGPAATAEGAFAQYQQAMNAWIYDPVKFCEEALGAQLDPWQCDALEAVMFHDNVAVRACHGVGKTMLEACAVLWFTMTRKMSKVPTTAPTFNKQVRDILWSEIHLRWQEAQKRTPWLSQYFDITVTRFFSKQTPQTWFAVGIPSAEAVKAEGYHSEHLFAVIDEAKGVKKTFFEALEGMRTTQEAKMLAVSTPGGPVGYFYDIFIRYRSTWKSQFIIHPAALQGMLKRKPTKARQGATGGTYYSTRVRKEWVEARRLEWGEESPVFVARVIGDFPQVSGDSLIQYGWIVDAEHREEGANGVPVVSCDVARYGRDRTVIFGGTGGNVTYCDTVARVLQENTDIQNATDNVGPDPSRPQYRSIVATADRCQLMRRKMTAQTGVDRVPIVIDDTGLNGVADILVSRGEYVIPIAFGASPTDKPKDADARASRQRRHMLDSKYTNIKAEMGWCTRTAFELGAVALASLPPQVLEPLIAQCTLMKYEMDSAGRLRLVDPDEEDEYAAAAGLAEGKKSPDHFHSLMLFLFISLQFTHSITPHAGPKLPKGIKNLGQGTTLPIRRQPAGQAAWIMRRFAR